MEIRQSIIDYLTEEVSINSDALKAYESDKLLPDNTNPEVIRMREIEAIKLRDRIHQIGHHIAVIKRMFPELKKPETKDKKENKKKHE